jgi:hypothetical protein
VYPVPAVKAEVLEEVSALPMTMELEAGVKDVTATAVEPALEPPVDVLGLVVVTP